MRETVLGFLASVLLRLLNATLRWEREGLHISGTHWSYYHKPIIVAFWHSDQLFAPFSYLGFQPPADTPDVERRRAMVLSSTHRDGMVAMKCLGFLSIGNIPGSSSKGGLRALVQMKQTIAKDGCHVTITPDGPRGPARQAKPGVVSLSSMTQAAILPIGFAYERAWKAKSWDKMLIPKPFSRARMVGGELMAIPDKLSKSQLREYAEKLTEVLDDLKDKAEEPFKVMYKEARTS